LSENVLGSVNVLFYEKEKPGMGKGSAGQLILTNQRVVYVKYLWKHWHAIHKNYVANIDEGLKNEGSIAIPTGQIIEAKTERTLGTPYLSIRYQTDAGEKTCSFIFSGGSLDSAGVLISKGPIEALAKTIENLKTKQ